MQYLTLSTYQYQSAFLEQWYFPFPYDGFNSAAQNYNISHKIHKILPLFCCLKASLCPHLIILCSGHRCVSL